MDYIIIAVVSWYLGMRFSGFMMQRAIMQLAKENGITLDNGQKKIKLVPLLITEAHEGTILLYDNDKQHFMCQGSTLDELATNFASTQNIEIAQVSHGNQSLWFVGGKVKTSME